MTREKLEECRLKGRKTLIEDIARERGKINGRTACDAMRAGDEAAAEVFRMYVYYLACGLVNIVNHIPARGHLSRRRDIQRGRLPSEAADPDGAQRAVRRRYRFGDRDPHCKARQRCGHRRRGNAALSWNIKTVC